MTTDEIIYEYIASKKSVRECQTPKEFVDYMINRFGDPVSFKEALYRFRNKIFETPKCKICGNKIKFGREGFANYCCRKCMSVGASITKKNNPNFVSNFSKPEVKEKIKQTCIKRYGVSNVFYLKEIHEKAKQTKLERYGDENYNNIEQFKKTCLEKYGCSVPAQNKEIREKQIKTLFEKYGGYFNKEQVSKNIQEKYGVEWFTQTDVIKEKNNTIEAREKQYKTKKKNKSFNTSKQEKECLELISKIYPNVIVQYRSEKYPFNCDFYIPSIDTYIEYNGSWTHGGHPFNQDNKADIDTLNFWKEKAKTSNFYKNAIHTWTKRDVNKRTYAKENNLNYYEFFNINELKEFLKII